jgi:antitoxin component of MazEF toxin-antitoxin module
MKTEKKIFGTARATRVTIPKLYLSKLGIQINEMVDVELKGNKIIITKMKEDDEIAI